MQLPLHLVHPAYRRLKGAFFQEGIPSAGTDPSPAENSLARGRTCSFPHPKVGNTCSPRSPVAATKAVHPWGKPSREKTPRRPERCFAEETLASFAVSRQALYHFDPAVCVCCLELLRRIVEPGSTPGGSRSCGRKKLSGQYGTAEVGHVACGYEKQGGY